MRYRFHNEETNDVYLINADTCEKATERFLDQSNVLTRTNWTVSHPLDQAPILAKRACNKALEAFWEEVALAFPEVESGVIDPIELARFEGAAQRAIEAWLDANL